MHGCRRERSRASESQPAFESGTAWSAVQTCSDMEDVSPRRGVDPVSGGEYEDDKSDLAVQSTFESRPSKSVADFPASGTVGPPTSAATLELEAKLRQRMLKCEGTDVLHRQTPRDVKMISELVNPEKVDELVLTASYQRCTKVRTQSSHSLTKGKKMILRELNPQKQSRSRSAFDEAQQFRTLRSLNKRATAHATVSPLSSDEEDGSSGFCSDFNSAASHYEFADPAERPRPMCTTFALDDPTRDAAEEGSDDAGITRVLDLKEDGSTDDGHSTHSTELSIEECLLDLVNHLPPKIAQRVGNLLQRLEARKQGQEEEAEALALARSELEIFREEREQAQAKLACSKRARDELHEEFTRDRAARDELRGELASTRARSAEAQESLRQQVSRAQAEARTRTADFERAQAEIVLLRKPAAEAVSLRGEVTAERSLVAQLRQEAREARSEAATARAEAERLHRRQEATGDPASNAKYVTVLASRLASVAADRDELGRELKSEQAEVLACRAESLELAMENRELRCRLDEVGARLETKARQAARPAAEGAEGSTATKAQAAQADRGQMHKARLGGELSTLRETLIAEAEELKKEVDRRGSCEAEAMGYTAASSPSRRHEACLGGELSILRKMLIAEVEELKKEVDRRGSCGAEAHALQALGSTAASSPSRGGPATPAGSSPGKGDVRVLRAELDAEREHLADRSKRAAQHESVRRDAKDVASRELKEFEEEGKARREQLQAETSLMAMEVVTLTKGLGGRLLDGGLSGLSRTHMTAHDIRQRLGIVGRSRGPHYGLAQGRLPDLGGPSTDSRLCGGRPAS
uniref:Uncharacterized protein n=1 Tax=Alexandrium monilatum TaxID=311494 RepID=A0A7S4T518_9DINO